jgi:hypothetical protein
MSPNGGIGIARLAALLALAPTPAFAYFEETAVGARGVALGSAAVAVISDATAYYWNPANLAALERGEVLADYAKPFGVPDLNVGSLAAGGRAWNTSWSVAWHRLAIADVYSEDAFYLAAGRQVADLGAHGVLAGLTYRLGRVAVQEFADPGTGATVDMGAQAKGTIDVGVTWRTPWRVDVAWVGRDVLQPRYELVPGSGGDLRRARSELAAAVRWHPESIISIGRAEQDEGPALLSAAIEIRFYEVFSIRSGLSNVGQIIGAYDSPNDLQYTGGFGIYHRGYFVDAAATTNHDLGASYRVTLRVPVGGGSRP